MTIIIIFQSFHILGFRSYSNLTNKSLLFFKLYNEPPAWFKHGPTRQSPSGVHCTSHLPAEATIFILFGNFVLHPLLVIFHFSRNQE